MQAKRAQLSAAERTRLSAQICEQLQQNIWKYFPHSAKILWFASKEPEVDIMPLADQFFADHTGNYPLFFPKVLSITDGIFSAFPVHDRSELILSGEHFGICEPTAEQPSSPQELDLVLVPAVAIDTRGFRVGYGKGFYDRFLRFVRPDCQKWAVVFSLQKVEKIAEESHDIAVDAIIDELSFSPLS